jgi:hypothetical protein
VKFFDLIGKKVFIQTTFSELESDMIGGSAANAEVTGVEPGGIWIERVPKNEEAWRIPASIESFVNAN